MRDDGKIFMVYYADTGVGAPQIRSLVLAWD
jgi:hypothetical protein